MMKNLFDRHRTLIQNGFLIVLFAGAIVTTTALTLGLSSISTTETVGFIFLAIITLSAFFGNLIVSVTVSMVATLCFDYFFLPPFGTLNVGSAADWISLAVFLLIAVVISKLTASAAQTKETNDQLTGALRNLTALGRWLVSQKQEELTLVGIAEETVRLFRFQYCSIHVYSCGKWDHAFGSARTTMAEQVEATVQKIDSPLDWTVMVTESELGVRYVQIRNQEETYAILAVKDVDTSPETLKTIGYLIGVRLACY